MLDMLILTKLKEPSAATDYEFLYGRTTLHAYLIKIGFQFRKADNQKVNMESPKLVAWRFKYLTKI